MLFLALLLGGCRDERIIEKMGFVRTLAFDTAENGDLKVTVSIPKSNQRDVILYTAVAKSARQANIIFDRQNDRRIVNGQLRQILFSVNAARRNVLQVIDALLRDPAIGNRTHLVVVDGEPDKMLEAKYIQAKTSGEYLEDLIRSEIKMMDIPVSNMHTFVRDSYDDGIDPVMAVIRQTPNSIIVDGIALFQGDRYVGKIEAEDKMYFGMLHSNLQSGDLAIQFPDEGYSSDIASLLYLKTSRKIRVERTGPAEDGGGRRVRIHIRVLGALMEYRGGLQLERKEQQKKLEAEIARYIQEKCEETVGRMQQLGSDAIGVGQRVRNSMSYREWKKLNWAEEFSKTKIEVQVEAGIRNFGEFQ